jgi:sigma-B regulation protein RsbU (phosphoserine phosphatase)
MEVLQETAVAKERIESELRIAHTIQMDLVPRTFPAFPDRREFRLFALLDPAREVGGDFYDFFFFDEEQQTLCLVIGDVSDKGMGAALFMAVTRTLLRSMARENQEPAVLLSRLNDELSRDNESCMFVTLFCAAVHLPSGRCRYASGGHCPPVVIRPDGELSRLTEAKGPVVGGMEGMLFTGGNYQFMPGEELFLYTDGVTEAANREKVLFGEERLNRELVLLKACSSEELIHNLRNRLQEFAEGAEQSDDITMLAFRYNGYND